MPYFKDKRSDTSMRFSLNFLQDRVLALKLMASGCNIAWPSHNGSNQLLPCELLG